MNWAGAHKTARQANERNKGLIFKNLAPFAACICEINNTQIYNAKKKKNGSCDAEVWFNEIQ